MDDLTNSNGGFAPLPLFGAAPRTPNVWQEVEYVLPPTPDFVKQYREDKIAAGSTLVPGQLNNEAVARYHHLKSLKVKECAQFRVEIDNAPVHNFNLMTIWHLAICRIDGGPLTWDDMQAIKNELCGEDVEALELYPAAARAITGPEVRHLWAFIGQRGNALDGKGGGRPIMPFGFYP